MGVFGAPQGVRGEVRVRSLTAEPSAIGAYGPLTDKNGARAFVFDSLRPLKDDMLPFLLSQVIAHRETRLAATDDNGVDCCRAHRSEPPF